MSASPPSPEELVERWGSLPAGSIALLTGGRGAGKTRWCEALARAAREAKLAVRGVLSPSVLSGGEKRAIDLLDLATGSRRFLAERARSDLPGTEGLGWRFDPEALAAGNVALERVGACDLLLVDELGPLELGRGSGFIAAFGLLDARRHGLAIVVVRPSLVAAAEARWPGATRLWDLGGDR